MNGGAVRQYLELMRRVVAHGTAKTDRTGTGTLSVFGHQMRFDLRDGFPLVTTKRLHVKSIIHELLWFLRGETNIGYLKDRGVSIWDEWADAQGDLGPIYGRQWRSWPGPQGEPIDQVGELIERIQNDPDSRRLIVSAWNVGELARMALPPCHLLFQFYVADGRLSCQLYQRSADVFLGVPFNIASYALLTLMVAHVTDLAAGRVHPYVWRRASVPEPPGSGAAAVGSRTAPPADHAAQPGRPVPVRLSLRGLPAGRLRPAPEYSRSGGRLNDLAWFRQGERQMTEQPCPCR